MTMRDSKVIQLGADQVLEDSLLRIGSVLVLQRVVEGNQKVEFSLEDFSQKIRTKVQGSIEIRKKL